MEKLTKLREHFATMGIDALLVTNAQNRRYLTGFTGSAGIVLITKTEAFLFVDFRYVEQAHAQAKGYTIEYLVAKEDVYREVARRVEELGIKALGFEQSQLSFELYNKYADTVRTELVPLSGAVERLRMIKDSAELALIRKAAEISDAAFSHITGFIRPGVTELDVANELEFTMRKLGASSSAFDIIIASGARSALPHGVASSKVIEKGDMVTLDFGAYYQGYRSDMTRTLAVGEPREELKNIYKIVLEALERGLAGIKPGITGREADAFTRDFITQKGFGDKYGHGSGHGIGLDIHEEPFMSTKCDVVLEQGMVLTVEPGIYLPGIGGVRIEDNIVLTEYGNERLTSSPKELLIL
ncbi:aminopeptidase P family protein [Brevibacillus fluminis]|uniref:Aminopeptidase P family protein n=1 Tax=Brevibacillus fluminis TaxID=511487 RepID=A0A3M8DQ82_9BACL|nr:Xaa-Pro peptidase family protein [Brevibacillus fluminis]RNB90273.1 aminopeptidase P family protein [Brevibacillus fluminis]